MTPLSSACRALTGSALFAIATGCARPAPHSAFDVGKRAPSSFEVDGEPFCFVGTNNYYLSYKPRPMVDDVLESAAAMGVKVVRTWAFIDRGSLDGNVRNVDGDGHKEGVYFQNWDPEARRPAANDGANGLQRLDYALAKAQALGLKLVLVLTNNWHDFGGMDQYVAWYDGAGHDSFYGSEPIRRAYRDWLAHLALRTNSLTGRRYRDDPTIFSWELANEPRASTGTPSQLITGWARDMSSYLKTLDPNHLVAVGDEGFLDGPSEHWTYHAQNGVDHRALTALPSIDYGTFHMYPEQWGTGIGWPERWIDDHVAFARALGKPTVLEEYGMRVTRDALGRITGGLAARLDNYGAWNERLLAHGGNASMFWLLVGRDSQRGGVYPDYDRYSVYRGDPSSRLLTSFATRFAEEAPACQPPSSAPIADAKSAFVTVRR